MTLASPVGRQPPLDPQSDVPDSQTEATERFKNDDVTQSELAHTIKLADVDEDKFDAVIFPRWP